MSCLCLWEQHNKKEIYKESSIFWNEGFFLIDKKQSIENHTLFAKLSPKVNQIFIYVKKIMDLSVYKQQMQKSIDYLEKELKALQVGRASAGLVENIDVNLSYGGSLKVPQIGHVTVLDGQTLKIEPRDKKELKNIEKAIYDSNAGVTPQNEGSYILIKVPPLTQDRRVEITKQIKAMGEDIKARIRLARQDAMKATKTLFDNKEIGEDQHKGNEREVDVIVKSMNETIDTLVKGKSEEIMKI